MGLIGLFLLALTIIFFTIFSTPQFWQSEAFQLISGFMEVLISNFVLIILLLLLVSIFPSSSGAIPMYGLGGLDFCSCSMWCRDRFFSKGDSVGQG